MAVGNEDSLPIVGRNMDSNEIEDEPPAGPSVSSSSSHANLTSIEVDHENPLKNSKPSSWLYLIAFVALVNSFSYGLVSGYYSAAIDSLVNQTSSNIQWDQNKESWIASSLTVGALVGGLTGGTFVAVVGPKMALILNNVPFIAGWLMIIFSRTFANVLIGRLLGGLGVGLTCVTVPFYLIEISTMSIRGSLGMAFQIVVNIGIFTSWALGIAFDFYYLAIISTVSCVISPIIFAFCPESPVYLAKLGLRDSVLKALRILRSRDSDIDAECLTLSLQSRSNVVRRSLVEDLWSFTKPSFYKPLLLSLGLMWFQQMTGINAVLFYQLDIFKQAGTTLDPRLCSLITGAVLIISTFLGALVIDRFGRKLLFNVGGLGMFISLLALGIYFQAADANGSEFTSKYGWVALVSLVIFLKAFMISFGPIPWLMIPEFTPSASRPIVSAISTCISWALAFIVAKEFPALEDWIGRAGAFYFLASMGALSCVFVTFALPETKGRSLRELESLFVSSDDN